MTKELTAACVAKAKKLESCERLRRLAEANPANEVAQQALKNAEAELKVAAKAAYMATVPPHKQAEAAAWWAKQHDE